MLRRTLHLLILAGSVAPAAFAAERPPMIWPAPLAKGDVIWFVAPAGPVERDQAERAKQRLEERGYRVKLREDLYAVEGYLAGSDERRAAEFMEAVRDPQAKAIFCTRGGYGTMRMLDRLDYDAIRQNPKIITGYSDITGLHLAINRRAGLITFHGPGPASGLGSPEGPTDFSAKHFFRAVEGPAAEDYAFEPPADFPPIKSFGRGKVRGRLAGGNLSLISALEGTPYAIDCEGAILVVEDVSEAPYRIDRMLRQLKLAGKLDQIRGAVLGQFTNVYEREDQAPNEDPRFTVDGVLAQYFENAGVPVLVNFPFGHAKENGTLPLGAEAELDAAARTLRILAH